MFFNSSHTPAIVCDVYDFGSLITCSTIPKHFRSSAVSFITSAASDARLRLSRVYLQILPEKEPNRQSFPESTLHLPQPEPVLLRFRLPRSVPKRSELLSRTVHISLEAIASPCPCSSASCPQNAPGVSTIQITGRPNFSACRINRNVFRYPSGDIIAKLRVRFSFRRLSFI